MQIFIWILLTRYILLAQSVSPLTDEVSLVLDKLLDKYQKEVRPGIGNEPVLIETHVSIRSFGKVSEVEMSYSFQCYLRQRWHDDRLRFHMGNVTEFTLSNRFLQYIWKPNTYFLNGKDSKAHNITVPNAFVRIRNDGHLYMSRRLTIKAKCPMHLYRYPMGKVRCRLLLGSFGYTTDDLLYYWKPSNGTKIDVYQGLTMSTFELGVITTFNTTTHSSLGTFSVLGIEIHLHRHIGFYVLQTYLPCYLICSLSWISFWINNDAAPARVLLGVTTILSTAAIGMTVREGLPRVAYATALDVFLNVCLVYEMAALFEYAVVNYFLSLSAKKGSEMEEEEIEPLPPPHRKTIYVNEADAREREILIGEDTCIDIETPRYKHGCWLMVWQCLVGNTDLPDSTADYLEKEANKHVHKIDKIARLLFPSTYIILNIVYWTAYLHLDS